MDLTLLIPQGETATFDQDSLTVLSGFVGVNLTTEVKEDVTDIQLISGDNTVVGFLPIVEHLCGLTEAGAQLFPEEFRDEILEQLSYRQTQLIPGLIDGQNRVVMPLVNRLNKALDFLVYIVQNKMTVADLVIIPCLYNFLKTSPEKMVLKLDNLLRWYDDIQHLPNFTADHLHLEIEQTAVKPPPPQPKQKKKKQPKKKE
eukprot:TRINITY_DN12460_c0_g1_i1.p1 TRINITY_DN12460_c0_g1~~TRINITY_DN12460_c0_g1_i1.p1  ORF type:complete len:201 (-),score=65.88 TRINITY_DN12460_c0_g1_i1:19-621(-)